MTETTWALEAQNLGDPPNFSPSRRKPTSKMAEAADETKYAKGDIVYVLLPASFERKSDLRKYKILSVSTIRVRGVMMCNLLTNKLRFGQHNVCYQM